MHDPCRGEIDVRLELRGDFVKIPLRKSKKSRGGTPPGTDRPKVRGGGGGSSGHLPRPSHGTGGDLTFPTFTKGISAKSPLSSSPTSISPRQGSCKRTTPKNGRTKVRKACPLRRTRDPSLSHANLKIGSLLGGILTCGSESYLCSPTGLPGSLYVGK